MASKQSVEKQLKAIRFNTHSWGRTEVSELPNILLDDEKIFECVNGMYEGGFALLVGTNIRLLLIDKKPMKYLTVEDVRFDMINQIDYSHRLMGAHINVSAGGKNLKFTSINQQRLRKLINHIQHRMAELKTQQHSSAQNQQQHLERINQQLQSYLLAQHQHQEELRKQLELANSSDKSQAETPAPAPPAIKPAPELSDFLYAQSLMQHYEAATGMPFQSSPSIQDEASSVSAVPPPLLDGPMIAAANIEPAQPGLPISAITSQTVANNRPAAQNTDSLIEAGRREVFGARARAAASVAANAASAATSAAATAAAVAVKPLHAPLAYLNTEVVPLKVAYAKLPLLLRQRKYNLEMQRLQRKQARMAAVQQMPSGPQAAGA